MSSPNEAVRLQAIEVLRQAAGDRPVRWANERTLPGDVEGREHTLELFDVEAHEQVGLFRALRPARREAERLLGGPVRVLFHTPVETTRHYSSVRPGGRLRLALVPRTKVARPLKAELGLDQDVLNDPAIPPRKVG